MTDFNTKISPQLQTSLADQGQIGYFIEACARLDRNNQIKRQHRGISQGRRLSIYLNGDIVSSASPTKASNINQRQWRLDNDRCRHGIKRWDCEKYTKYRRSKGFSDERKGCPHHEAVDCPFLHSRHENGKKQKTFKITYPAYRQLTCQVIKSSHSNHYKLLFLTLTFPPFREGVVLPPGTANKLFSKFIHNLRKTYSAGDYIAVREGDGITKRLHFHLIVSMPFVSFKIINSYWNEVIKDYCLPSNNSVTTKKDSVIIRDPIKAARYVCKYLSKVYHESKAAPSETRIIFTSHNSEGLRTDVSAYEINQITKGYTTEIVILNDYCTMYKVRGNVDRFIKDVVFSFLPQKKPDRFRLQAVTNTQVKV